MRMKGLPVGERSSNSHCSQLVLLIMGEILTDWGGANGDVEKLLGPSSTSKAVLLLTVHTGSSHFVVKS